MHSLDGRVQLLSNLLVFVWSHHEVFTSFSWSRTSVFCCRRDLQQEPKSVSCQLAMVSNDYRTSCQFGNDLLLFVSFNKCGQGPSLLDS